MQRYLTGKSIGQSRLSLLFNAVAKVPMQFFILFIGAMVFVFFLFVTPAGVSSGRSMKRWKRRRNILPSKPATTGPSTSAKQPRVILRTLIRPAARTAAIAEFRAAQKQLDAVHQDALKIAHENDTNYIFLSFVTHYLPRGVVGLIIGVIFTAAMSPSPGEINRWPR